MSRALNPQLLEATRHRSSQENAPGCTAEAQDTIPASQSNAPVQPGRQPFVSQARATELGRTCLPFQDMEELIRDGRAGPLRRCRRWCEPSSMSLLLVSYRDLAPLAWPSEYPGISNHHTPAATNQRGQSQLRPAFLFQCSNDSDNATIRKLFHVPKASRPARPVQFVFASVLNNRCTLLLTDLTMMHLRF
ncbi:hypothetical protein GGTG_07898 [Gaeumannomyces tritici R3-111a-1]|uniref:Uncharacterized protein n=1 Tax=Gaeumannomyces tritici (strain R3-111a-1) TaxID=644352 RepID=J3P307_GAET3|nr:hypothetical protein GGTG_07898 [Gaeumannomyces tritici R3-111a-1]EJT74049.1 hypothetical protein GGTG_07898 [Gaeumannomyces tritici R3-111a-1]